MRKNQQSRFSGRHVSIQLILFTLLLASQPALAQITGRLSGTAKDPAGLGVPNALVNLKSAINGAEQSTNTSAQGTFTFPAVPVGSYQLDVVADGLTTYRRSAIAVDTGSAQNIEISLQLAARGDTVNVTESSGTIETADTQLGQVVSGSQITTVPLNGRSYTDLLAVQVGVNPITTSGQTNNTSGGSFGYVPVSGGLRTGQFSLHGQRESSNGFFLNGVSVQEAIGQQAGIIPNLDSIAEFRILTGNAEAQYGGYSGGLVNVVTKGGSNAVHGSAFEFLRNTALDARNYFSPERATFQQNEFGGTLGGPLKKDKLFTLSIIRGNGKFRVRRLESSMYPHCSTGKEILPTQQAY